MINSKHSYYTRPRKSQPMDVDKPDMESVQEMTSDNPDVPMREPSTIKNTDDKQFMEVDEKASVKRQPQFPDSKAAMIHRARQGEFISVFQSKLDNKKITEHAIKEQMIMHGIDFHEDTKKQELHLMINSANWSDYVNDQIIKQRLKTYTDEHGSLPI